jgi:hypothetical protein
MKNYFLLLITLLFTSYSFAQVSSLKGRVLDSNGFALPGATIQLVTNCRRETKREARGRDRREKALTRVGDKKELVSPPRRHVRHTPYSEFIYP